MYLHGLFVDFCEYFNGRLRWSASRTDWTEAILSYFAKQAEKEKATVENGYMLVDQIWRGQNQQIILALEHENDAWVNELLEKEVAHLIDLRAMSKVGIFYPDLGDEKLLIDNIASRIANRAMWVHLPNETYLFILGFLTKKQKQPAILLKAFLIDSRGQVTERLEQIILQKTAESSGMTV